MDLTVVMANYLRPRNVAIILHSLFAQSIVPRLFVWDNSPDGSFADPRADWVVRSSRNAQCGARWWLAGHADTDWVLVMDDDLVPRDDRVLADTVAKLTECAPLPVGATGVVLERDKDYRECRHVGLQSRRVRGDVRVDILKGRYFAASPAQVRKVPFLPLGSEDDIAASASMGGGVVAACLQGRFRELPTGRESWSARPGHDRSREAERRRCFGVS